MQRSPLRSAFAVAALCALCAYVAVVAGNIAASEDDITPDMLARAHHASAQLDAPLQHVAPRARPAEADVGAAEPVVEFLGLATEEELPNTVRGAQQGEGQAHALGAAQPPLAGELLGDEAAADVGEVEQPEARCPGSAYDFSTANYCGAHFFTGESYPGLPSAAGSWSLASVQLLTRHGDRTPVNIAPTYDIAFDVCDINQSIGFLAPEERDSAAAERGVAGRRAAGHHKRPHPRPHPHGPGRDVGRRLRQVPVINPPSLASPFSNQLWQGNCATGQLTTRGIDQLQAIGAGLRAIYIEKLGLLPETYSANASFYLRSTDVWRTKQSAEALLMGLFPEDGADAPPIPVHTFPLEIETMFPNALACDRVGVLQLAQFDSAPWAAHLNYSALWAQLDDVMGLASDPTWHTAYDHFVDNFKTRQCHGLPLPCKPGQPQTCVTQETADFVYAQGDWEYDYTQNLSPQSKKLAQIGMGAFMSVVRDVMVAHVSGNHSVSSVGAPALAYYSGHDTTLGAVLGFFNVTGMRWPPYASNMLFELWANNAPGAAAEEAASEAEVLEVAAGALPASAYSVRVLYNGQVLRLFGLGCCDELCPFTQVKAYMDSMIPTDIAQQCVIPPPRPRGE